MRAYSPVLFSHMNGSKRNYLDHHLLSPTVCLGRELESEVEIRIEYKHSRKTSEHLNCQIKDPSTDRSEDGRTYRKLEEVAESNMISELLTEQL